MIFIVAFALVDWVLAGFATTNILRLTARNRLPVFSSICRCENCSAPITPFEQLPIISYIICKGKCRHCKIKLPIDALILEIVVWIGTFSVSLIFSFSYLGVLGSMIYYEIVRVVMICLKGRRADAFIKQYFLALLGMLPFATILLFISTLYQFICAGNPWI